MMKAVSTMAMRVPQQQGLVVGRCMYATTVTNKASTTDKISNVASAAKNTASAKMDLENNKRVAKDSNASIGDRVSAAAQIPLDAARTWEGKKTMQAGAADLKNDMQDRMNNNNNNSQSVRGATEADMGSKGRAYDMEDSFRKNLKDASDSNHDIQYHKNVATDPDAPILDRAKAAAQIPVDKVKEWTAAAADTLKQSEEIQRKPSAYSTNSNTHNKSSMNMNDNQDLSDLEKHKNIVKDPSAGILDRVTAAAQLPIDKLKEWTAGVSQEEAARNTYSQRKPDETYSQKDRTGSRTNFTPK